MASTQDIHVQCDTHKHIHKHTNDSCQSSKERAEDNSTRGRVGRGNEMLSIRAIIRFHESNSIRNIAGESGVRRRAVVATTQEGNAIGSGVWEVMTKPRQPEAG